MTVKELITELNKMPKDAIVEIIVPCGYENCGGEVEFVKMEKEGNVEIYS